MLPYYTLSLHIHHPDFRMQSFITKVLSVCKMPGLQTYQTWQQKIQWIRRYLCCPKQMYDRQVIQTVFSFIARSTVDTQGHSHHDQSAPLQPPPKNKRQQIKKQKQAPHYQQKHNRSEMTRNLFSEVGGKYTT